MPCRVIRSGDGAGIGIGCSRGERRRGCSYPNCQGTGTRLCDAPVVRKGVEGTCDAALCATHAWVHEGEDLCPPHRKLSLSGGNAPKAPLAASPRAPEAIGPEPVLPGAEDERRLKRMLAAGLSREAAIDALGAG